MASLLLRPVGVNFLASHTVLHHHTILLNVVFKHDDDYLAISLSILSSYVVGFDAWLGEHCEIFWLRWDILGCPTPKK